MADDDPRRPRTLVRAGTAALVGRPLRRGRRRPASGDRAVRHRTGTRSAPPTRPSCSPDRASSEATSRARGRCCSAAIDVLEAHPPGPALAHAATRMAGHLWVVGDLEACVSWSERALGLAREMALHSEEVLALQYRGASRSKLGDEGGLDDLARGAAHRRRSTASARRRRSRTTTTPTSSGTSEGRAPRSRSGRRWRRSARHAGSCHVVRLGARRHAGAPVRRRRVGPGAQHRRMAPRLG